MVSLSPHLIALMMDEPFYAYFLRYLTIAKTQQVETAVVRVQKNSLYLMYNPTFLMSLTPPEIRGLLKNKILHVALGHYTHRRRDPLAVSTVAAELAVNSEIPKKELPKYCIWPGKPAPLDSPCPDLAKLVESFQPHMSAEHYFGEIMHSPQAGTQCKEMQHTFAPDDYEELSDEDLILLDDMTKEALRKACKACNATGRWGTISSTMRGQLQTACAHKVNWKGLLARFCGYSQRSKNRTLTWNRVNVGTLHPVYGPLSQGVKKEMRANIGVYYDQSGSMSDEDVAEICVTVAPLQKHVNFRSYAFDTEVDEESGIKWTGNTRPVFTRTLCGGTDFSAPTRHAIAKGFNGLLIFTDGNAEKPCMSRIPRGFLVTPRNALAFIPDTKDFVMLLGGAS